MSPAKDEPAPEGVLAAVRERFADLADSGLSEMLTGVYEFRNTYVAHVKDELTEQPKVDDALRHWIKLIWRLNEISSAEPAAGKA